jgi:hypothetical protein
MKITVNGVSRDATPEEQAAIEAQQVIDSQPREKTPEQIDAERRAAYAAEADPLFMEFLAEKFKTDPAAAAAVAAREAVKERLPKVTRAARK